MTTQTAHSSQEDRTCRQNHDAGGRQDQQRPCRNPRLVIGGLDYFELLQEQEEQG